MATNELINTIQHTDIFSLCAQLPDQSIDMILCDLPYGTTACAWDEIIPLEPMWAEFKRVIKPRGAVVLTASQPFTSKLVMSNPKWYRSNWIWDKVLPAGFQLANVRQLKQHEEILVFGYPSVIYYPQKVKRKTPINGGKLSASKLLTNKLIPLQKSAEWEFPRSILRFSNADHAGNSHPTQKPVALFEYIIKTYTQEGEIVFDPCVGGGTTALAAMKTGRRYICGDITEEYVNIARKRLQNADPYQPSIKANGVVQHSLFEAK